MYRMATKKIRVTGAGNHSATLAGTVYYEQLLSVKPPERYDYQQSLEQDKYIRGHKGERIQVRRRGADGNYKILPAGVDFFRFHSSFWTPLFPRIIIRKTKDGHEVVPPRSGWGYVPLADAPHLTSATLRQRAGDRSKPVFATDDEQRAEVIAAAKAHLATLDTLYINGKTYTILFFASEVGNAYDASKPILVDRQLTTFQNNRPPTPRPSSTAHSERPRSNCPKLCGDPSIATLIVSAIGNTIALSRCSTSP